MSEEKAWVDEPVKRRWDISSRREEFSGTASLDRIL